MLRWFETVNLIKRDQKWVEISSLGAGSAVSLRAFSALGSLVRGYKISFWADAKPAVVFKNFYYTWPHSTR